jgi:hypothetical protein
MFSHGCFEAFPQIGVLDRFLRSGLPACTVQCRFRLSSACIAAINSMRLFVVIGSAP